VCYESKGSVSDFGLKFDNEEQHVLEVLESLQAKILDTPYDIVIGHDEEDRELKATQRRLHEVEMELAARSKAWNKQSINLVTSVAAEPLAGLNNRAICDFGTSISRL
jgi:hypothetical protein